MAGPLCSQAKQKGGQNSLIDNSSFLLVKYGKWKNVWNQYILIFCSIIIIIIILFNHSIQQ